MVFLDVHFRSISTWLHNDIQNMSVKNVTCRLSRNHVMIIDDFRALWFCGTWSGHRHYQKIAADPLNRTGLFWILGILTFQELGWWTQLMPFYGKMTCWTTQCFSSLKMITFDLVRYQVALNPLNSPFQCLIPSHRRTCWIIKSKGQTSSRLFIFAN